MKYQSTYIRARKTIRRNQAETNSTAIIVTYTPNHRIWVCLAKLTRKSFTYCWFIVSLFFVTVLRDRQVISLVDLDSHFLLLFLLVGVDANSSMNYGKWLITDSLHIYRSNCKCPLGLKSELPSRGQTIRESHCLNWNSKSRHKRIAPRGKLFTDVKLCLLDRFEVTKSLQCSQKWMWTFLVTLLATLKLR